MSSWPFLDPEDVAVFTTQHVLDGSAILYVVHDEEDGAWQFHDGIPATEQEAKIVALGEIVELDPTLAQLADLPLGFFAERKSKGSPWIRSRR